MNASAAIGRPRGRPPGSKNRCTLEREAATRAAAAAVAGLIPEPFGGDALALLQAVYLDPRLPLALRLDAAKAALRYERPALAAVAVEAHLRRSIHDLTDAELLLLLAGEAEAALGASPSGAAAAKSDPGAGA